MKNRQHYAVVDQKTGNVHPSCDTFYFDKKDAQKDVDVIRGREDVPNLDQKDRSNPMVMKVRFEPL